MFHGRVSEDGERLELASFEQGKRRRYLRFLKGQRVELVIRKARTKRSLDQNGYWHAVVFPMIAAECGYSIPEAKLVVLGECFGWKKDRILGRDIPLKPHSSELTTAEGAYFTDWVIPWAVETLGLEIPLPREVIP